MGKKSKNRQQRLEAMKQKQWHFCNVCNRDMKTWKGLLDHLASVISHEGCVLCKKCGFISLSANENELHQTKHGKDLPYKCPDCEVGYHHEASYLEHIERHRTGRI